MFIIILLENNEGKKNWQFFTVHVQYIYWKKSIVALEKGKKKIHWKI